MTKYKDNGSIPSTLFVARYAILSRVMNSSPNTSSALQRQLAQSIASHIREAGLQAGDPVNQLAIAEKLGVSRTPVRAALAHLADIGLVSQKGRGVTVVDPTIVPVADEPVPGVDALIQSLSRAWRTGQLPHDVTEAELMRRHHTSRLDVAAALKRLADLGLVMRKPGFGWRFLDQSDTPEARAASYRFRLAIEPAALLEPDYRLDSAWLTHMRERHRQFMAQRWHESHSVAFFEMNAEFHLGLVSASGNRFFTQAMQQQNSLRRLRNYSWTYGDERVQVSCADHLGIIAALETGDRAKAAGRLKAHLRGTAGMVAGRVEGEASPDE